MKQEGLVLPRSRSGKQFFGRAVLGRYADDRVAPVGRLGGDQSPAGAKGNLDGLPQVLRLLVVDPIPRSVQRPIETIGTVEERRVVGVGQPVLVQGK